MKSITIHSMDDNLAAMLKAKALEHGQSLNKTIKQLLETALGIKVQKHPTHGRDYQEFLGAWTQDDCDAFQKASKEFSSVDTDDWK